MKGKPANSILRYLITVLASAALIMAFNIFLDGMYLIGAPDAGDVEKVTVSYPEVSGTPKEFSDEENIKLAVQLTGFLRYSLFEKAPEGDAPLMTVTYFLKDGTAVEISASRDTVGWKGKARAIKEKEMFINLAEGIFFLDEVME